MEASLNFPVKILISWSNLLADSFEKQTKKLKNVWHQDDDLFCRMMMEQSASTVWPFSTLLLFCTLEVTFKKEEKSASQFVVLKLLFVAGCAHGRLRISSTMQLVQSYCTVCQHLTAQLLCQFQLFLLLEISRILPKSAANVASRGDRPHMLWVPALYGRWVQYKPHLLLLSSSLYY